MNFISIGDKYELDKYGVVEILDIYERIEGVSVDAESWGALDRKLLVRINTQPEKEVVAEREIETIPIDKFITHYNNYERDKQHEKVGE